MYKLIQSVRLWLFLLLASSLSLLACNRGGPLSANQMKEIMWDLSQGDEFVGYYVRIDTLKNLDSAYRSVYARVLTLHNVSVTEFNNTIAWYNKRPDDYKVLIDSLNKYANRQREKLYRPDDAVDSLLVE